MKIIGEVFRFGLVGLLNTGVTLLVLFLFTRFTSWSYVVINIIGYGAGLTNSYIFNRLWTFKSRGNVLKEGTLFFLVFIASYTLQLTVLVILREITGVNPYLAQGLGMVVYTASNFLINKFITFRG